MEYQEFKIKVIEKFTLENLFSMDLYDLNRQNFVEPPLTSNELMYAIDGGKFYCRLSHAKGTSLVHVDIYINDNLQIARTFSFEDLRESDDRLREIITSIFTELENLS